MLGKLVVCVQTYRSSDQFTRVLVFERRSQWLRGLKYELSSPHQTLGRWVRI
jgi:hypothetical protein